MKVNVYEDESVQKGKLMLLNLAEDLKEYAKIKVAPGNDKKQQDSSKGEKKPESMEELKQMSDKQAFVKLDSNEIDDADYYDDEDADRAAYLYMELQSTSSFRDIDIDEMIKHTTLDDFMQGLYSKQQKEARYSVLENKQSNVMAKLLTGHGLEVEDRSEQVFGEEVEEEASNMADELRRNALIALRDRRMRLK